MDSRVLADVIKPFGIEVEQGFQLLTLAILQILGRQSVNGQKWYFQFQYPIHHLLQFLLALAMADGG